MNENYENGKINEQSQQSKGLMRRMAFTSLKAGCLTFLVAGVALLVGLFIDIRQDTLPRWMLIFLVGSMPFTLGGLYFIVRHEIKKIRVMDQTKEEQLHDSREESG